MEGIVTGTENRAPRIADAFAAAKSEGRAALIAYITGGYPDLATFPAVLAEVAKHADIVEVGIPYSDPMADGPTIQLASEKVLAAGTNTEDIARLVAQVRPSVGVPIAFMGYWNTVFAYGMERYADMAAAAGVRATIIPDLPPEEAAGWLEIADARGIDNVFLVAPTSSDERLGLIGGIGRGFIYCVSLTGVTGARSELPADLSELVARVRAHTDKPVAVGFGISTPEHVRTVAAVADGVIVGSALIKTVSEASGAQDAVRRVAEYLAPLREATVRGG